jgi:hypothetical protein
VRYDLPPGLSADEVRAIHAALAEFFGYGSVRPGEWLLIGRAEAIGLGALQIRNQSLRPWQETTIGPFSRKGIETRVGRGDAK